MESVSNKNTESCKGKQWHPFRDTSVKELVAHSIAHICVCVYTYISYFLSGNEEVWGVDGWISQYPFSFYIVLLNAHVFP